MNRTNSEIVKEAIRQHIWDSVRDYEDNEFASFEGAAEHLRNEFDRVANYPYNLKEFPNNQERFSDYMNGGIFDFHIYYDDIRDFLYSLDLNGRDKEYSDSQAVKMYHYLIYKAIL